MGISASVGTQIPTNVVEVGTEISQPSLDAISSAPSATSVNRFVVLNDLTAKANLAGASFTGKVNLAPLTVSSASLNLGVGTAPTTTVAGDIWIGTNIVYKASDGTQKAVANMSTANFFTGHQVIHAPVGTTFSALRVTQLGTGNAIEVEDNTTPDATRFVVDQFGKVGIGVAPDVTACLSVDATGIKFNDGTTQTTSAGGIIGPTGPTGPAGANATAWVYKGAYDNGYTYTVGDFVDLNGSSYVMISFIGAGGYPPPSGAWQLVASIGGTGPTGGDGPQGANGNDGGSFSDATYDNTPYIRRNQAWEPLSSWDQTGIGDAPNDGNHYVRQNGNWVACSTTNINGYNVLYL